MTTTDPPTPDQQPLDAATNQSARYDTSLQRARSMGLNIGDEISIGTEVYVVVQFRDGKVLGERVTQRGAFVLPEELHSLDLRLPGWKILGWATPVPTPRNNQPPSSPRPAPFEARSTPFRTPFDAPDRKSVV